MKDVVSEPALDAESKIIFMSGLFNFWQMIMAPGLLAILQTTFSFFLILHEGAFFV